MLQYVMDGLHVICQQGFEESASADKLREFFAYCHAGKGGISKRFTNEMPLRFLAKPRKARNDKSPRMRFPRCCRRPRRQQQGHPLRDLSCQRRRHLRDFSDRERPLLVYSIQNNPFTSFQHGLSYAFPTSGICYAGGKASQSLSNWERFEIPRQAAQGSE